MTQTNGSPGGRPVIPPILWIIVVLCVAIELTLTISDSRGGLLRPVAFTLGAFQPSLLHGNDSIYPGQSVVMFLSYSLFHGDLAHLAVNMLSLVGLGSVVASRIGSRRFLVIYLATALGGSIGYALLGPADIPMVGASGALFGLVGVLIAWEIAAARARRASLAPAARLVLLLVVLNVVLWWATGGMLAWQTHLGGAVAGLILGLIQPPPPARQA